MEEQKNGNGRVKEIKKAQPETALNRRELLEESAQTLASEPLEFLKEAQNNAATLRNADEAEKIVKQLLSKPK